MSDHSCDLAHQGFGRHTERVRWACLVCLLLAAGRGEAKPVAPHPTPSDRGDFWRDVIEPNGDQVRALLKKARDAMQHPDNALAGDVDWAVDQRLRFYRDAYNLLRHARKLSPQDAEVLALLGRAADELGKTREAIDALETNLRIVGVDKAGADVAGRLGAIYLRLGDRDTAIRWLRVAQGSTNPNNPNSGAAVIHLANALVARGEVTAAIDSLQNALPPALLNYQNPEISLVAFSLAVIYDRDEQRAAAFEMLDHMQTTLQQQYAPQLLGEISKLRFAPAEDQHYYLALLYESLGHYVEARAEWALYAASGDSPWRRRALDHITAIDHERRAKPNVKPAITPPTPGVIRRRPPP